MEEKNPEFFYEFINDLLDSDLSISKHELGTLLEEYGFSPQKVISSVTSENNYGSIPTFSWEAGGYDITYNSNTYAFSNDKFQLKFYDQNNNLILTTRRTINTTYTPTSTEWN